MNCLRSDIPTTETGKPVSPAKILFVDDDTMFLRLMRVTLEKYKPVWEMDFIQNPQAAADKIPSQKYDIVLTDVKMPHMDGFALLKTIREHSPDTVVILITGMPDVNAAVRAIKAGAVEYLRKPINIVDLEHSLIDALEERDQRMEDATRRCIPVQNCRIAGYKLIRKLDEGSMGTVYLVEDSRAPLPKRYALKVLKISTLPSHDRKHALRRFKREAKTAQSIRHPNVIHLHEFGFTPQENTPYMVMEYFDGIPLNEFVSTISGLSYFEKAIIVQQIAAALSEVHKYVLCHRDVKPGNILVDSDYQVKLIDFGVAKLLDSDLTKTDCTMGTPAYLSPEAIIDVTSIGPQSDLFALGVMAYELFLGKRPFNGSNIAALARQIALKPAEDPWNLDPDLPATLRDMIMTLLEKKPEKRFPEAFGVVAAIDDYLSCMYH